MIGEQLVLPAEVIDTYVIDREDRLAAIAVERIAYKRIMNEMDVRIDVLDTEAYKLKCELHNHGRH